MFLGTADIAGGQPRPGEAHQQAPLLDPVQHPPLDLRRQGGDIGQHDRIGIGVENVQRVAVDQVSRGGQGLFQVSGAGTEAAIPRGFRAPRSARPRAGAANRRPALTAPADRSPAISNRLTRLRSSGGSDSAPSARVARRRTASQRGPTAFDAVGIKPVAATCTGAPARRRPPRGQRDGAILEPGGAQRHRLSRALEHPHVAPCLERGQHLRAPRMARPSDSQSVSNCPPGCRRRRVTVSVEGTHGAAERRETPRPGVGGLQRAPRPGIGQHRNRNRPALLRGGVKRGSRRGRGGGPSRRRPPRCRRTGSEAARCRRRPAPRGSAPGPKTR